MSAGAREATRPSRTRLAPEARREQILEAAVGTFRGRAYDDVSLADVAEAAGVARGLISHHFGTKRDLYVEVVRREVRVPELPVPAYEQGASPRSRLEASVDALLDAVEENRELWLDSITLAGLADPEIAAVAEQAREEGVQRAAEVMGLGPVEELSPERIGMLRAWSAIAEEAIRQWLDYGRFTRAQVEILIVDTGTRLATGLLDELAAAIGEAG